MSLYLLVLLEYNLRKFEKPSHIYLAHSSLAKTFLQSYQGIWAIFKARRRCYPNFFGYKFIIHQSSYL